MDRVVTKRRSRGAQTSQTGAKRQLQTFTVIHKQYKLINIINENFYIAQKYIKNAFTHWHTEYIFSFLALEAALALALRRWRCNAHRRVFLALCTSMLHIHTSGKWVFDYKRQDVHEGIDFGHPGGATCKFSGQFTVELVRTKKRTFYLRNLAKSIVPTHVKW